MSSRDDPLRPHRLDAETINLGRTNIERIRQQLKNRQSVSPPPYHADRSSARLPVDTVVPAELSADRMAAEMAAGAERDRLEERVAQLEGEVAQLRAALAGVLDAAATGLRNSSPVNHRS